MNFGLINVQCHSMRISALPAIQLTFKPAISVVGEKLMHLIDIIALTGYIVFIY